VIHCAFCIVAVSERGVVAIEHAQLDDSCLGLIPKSVKAVRDMSRRDKIVTSRQIPRGIDSVILETHAKEEMRCSPTNVASIWR